MHAASAPARRWVAAGREVRERLGWPWLAAVAVALLIPAVRMLRWIRAGTPTQFADYWFMLDESIGRGDRIDVRGVFAPHNEHLVVVPKTIYLLNLEAFGGSNRSLGVVVVLVVLAQLALLTVHLARRRDIRPIVLASFALSASAVAFVPRGAWSYLRAMSGTAWLTANLFAVVAVLLASRRRPLLATCAATLAALSYGTGLLALPAILVAGLLVDRRWRRQWPVIVGGLVMGAVYVRVEQGASSASRDAPKPILDVLENVVRIPGAMATDGQSAAVWVGVALVATAVGLAVFAVRADARSAAPWVGLLVYSVGTVALVGYGRENGFTDFTTSRYTALGALVWIAALGLLVLVGRTHVATVLPLLAVAVLALSASTRAVDSVTGLELQQRELTNAFALGVADGAGRYISFGAKVPPMTDHLRAASHHPFDGRWDADCGLLGRPVPDDLVADAARSGLDGWAGPTNPARGVGLADEVIGHVERPDDVDCIVAADPAGTVVGVGEVSTTELSRRGGRIGRGDLRVIAPRGGGPLTVYVVMEGDDTLYRLPFRAG